MTDSEIIYDLFVSLLWSKQTAAKAFLDFEKKITKEKKSKNRFIKYERPWLFKKAFEVIKNYIEHSQRTLSPAEQVMLDSKPDPKVRLKFFDSYFHRLNLENQFLLILKDKYKLPIHEIAAILNTPEETVYLKHGQALRQLESWIWSEHLGML